MINKVEFGKINYFKIFISEKYSGIYESLCDEKLEIKDLFYLCAVIGFKNNHKEKIEKKQKEFNSSYYSDKSIFLSFYSMIFDKINYNFEEMKNESFFNNYFKDIEEYAEGGMSILLEEVIKNNYNKNTNSLNPRYKDKFLFDVLNKMYKSRL
ncbi:MULTISPECIES: hypothetical protein [Oceanotoga]|uniref:hypothetical protein n=1 Tax=Oceanotoga TaxID=1255275 RepID=UPI002656B295|nr:MULTISPECIES: hypothetical protein [Oceanotoga]MDN5343815.1 hypothetical protein [Oceanotoga sp.]MDO7977296.1 hypothetical protein [Oceanotoga teriensis]